MLGTALFERGAGEAAEHQYRQVLARQPHNPQARVALAEVLLYQRRFGEAADEAAALEPDSPLAAMAVRSEFFGRIVAGQLDGLAGARARAREAQMPLAEIELFDAWAKLAGGEPAETKLRGEAIGLLGAVLESLLRVEQFSAFEQLVGLLRASALAEREQRELLATIYLRRGFVASAAQEWMAACETGPDARALVGLARIARAQGMSEDVAVFAAKALEIEPDNAEARRLAGGLTLRSRDQARAAA
jgi:hypothetical protein